MAGKRKLIKLSEICSWLPSVGETLALMQPFMAHENDIEEKISEEISSKIRK